MTKAEGWLGGYRKYSIQAEVPIKIMSVSSHFFKIALPGDFSPKRAKLALAFDLQ